ncbi:MAG: DUF4124 domain-containing protein [Sideroxyarcus sp.]|nr:DUF4124 domain-containing protein [Sideroxyarcus sp.]
MCRELPLFLAVLLLPCLVYADTYRCRDANGYFAYTDKPCAGEDSADDASVVSPSDSNSRTEQGNFGGGQYTKDLAPMRSPDAATQACFNYMNTTARFPDPSTSKLLSGTKKWVSVKDVGGRQMVTIGVTSKNDAGMYVGIQTFDCLLMGDNVTVNTGEYELL